MKYRMLGRTNFDVSEIGYGAWGIGGSQWIGAAERTSLAALHKAIELGVNFIDTALAYGQGNSERIVGRAIEDAGREIYIATKAPPKNLIWPARLGIGIADVFPYDHIIACAEKSLQNLRVDAIDLLQLHVWNPEWIDRDDWKRGFEDLKTSGKVRAVGISINDHQPDSALEAIETGLIDSVQVIYNIFDQTPEEKLFPLCREKNIGVIARVPFDEGSLTGRITEDTTFPAGDFRNHYFKDDRKRQVAEHIDALVKELDYPANHLPELALRFCLSNPAVTTVIPGMRTVENVEKNCTAPGQGPLPETVREILKRHAWNRNFYA
ncbi:MAG: aldo/keto reductase [Acidobacteriota bacterium]|nr:aldo/keto reductase [Acidobacteriota bacterium]